MEPFERVICPATAPGWTSRGKPITARVFVKIEWDGAELSMSGVEGPTRGGDAHGACGQIVMGADGWTPRAPWTGPDVARLVETWNRWHLNGMRAGAPDQEAAIREWTAAGNRYEYGSACAHLASLGILDSKSGARINVLGRGERQAMGYRYGSGWVTEAVPDDVLSYLAGLPVADTTPAWV